jgi:CBS-domain-containing membrane protein
MATMKVDEVMTHDAVSCRSSESLAQAAQLMWDNDCGCVPVVDDEERVIGMVTDRDVCMAALHSGKPLHETPIGDVMAKRPATVRPDDGIDDAQDVMCEKRVRRLPVTDVAGRLVGVLSLHDLARSAVTDRRWFSGVKMRDVAKTFAEVSRPWEKVAPPKPRPNIGYAE